MNYKRRLRNIVAVRVLAELNAKFEAEEFDEGNIKESERYHEMMVEKYGEMEVMVEELLDDVKYERNEEDEEEKGFQKMVEDADREKRFLAGEDVDENYHNPELI